MNTSSHIRPFITLVICLTFLNSCYMTTHRGPRTLEPGKVSASASYLHLKGSDTGADTTPTQLIALEGRVGVLKGVDLGFMKTFDITEGIEPDQGIDTYWFDTKFQLVNRDNILNKPTLSFGYGFGNVTNIDDFWMNNLHLLLGFESEKASYFYSFRVETADEDINLIPSWVWEAEFDELSKAHILGVEYALNSMVKPVFEMGRFYYDDFGSGINVFTAGVNFYLQ